MNGLKKFLVVTLAGLCIFGVAGCEKVEKGDYKEGTYYASVVDDYNNAANTASAVMYVNENGVIKSLFLDTTYTSNEVVTTKKTLKNDYNMKTYNTAAAGEWYEQIEKLEKAIVDAQGLDDIKIDANGYTDSVSGCTIKVDALIKAVTDVLNQAK